VIGQESAPLSDVRGRIAHVFFALPAYDPSFVDPLLGCFRGIREALGPSVCCTVLHRPAQAAPVREHLGGSGPLDTITWDEGFVLRLADTRSTIEGGTLRITRMALPDFTSWVQDAFLVGMAGDGTTCVWASPHVRRGHGGWDDEVPARLAKHLVWELRTLPCAIEAGNVLVDEGVVVVGPDVPAAATREQWEALYSILAAGGRRVIVPGHGEAQPLFHLDLYVTPAGPHPTTGERCALVGSARLARELTGQPADDAAVDAKLDAVSAQLASQGFFVERLPLLPFTSELAPKVSWYSYNNCLVEVAESVRRVVLPAYGAGDDGSLDTLDMGAARVWSNLGFEVRFARGAFAHLAQLGGSVRCMTKVLRRSDHE
jgi:hypothetical protein